MGLAITIGPTQTNAAPTELGLAFGGRRGYKHGAPNELGPLWRPQMRVTVSLGRKAQHGA